MRYLSICKSIIVTLGMICLAGIGLMPDIASANIPQCPAGWNQTNVCPEQIDYTLVSGTKFRYYDRWPSSNQGPRQPVSISLPYENLNGNLLEGIFAGESNNILTYDYDFTVKYDATDVMNAGCEVSGEVGVVTNHLYREHPDSNSSTRDNNGRAGFGAWIKMPYEWRLNSQSSNPENFPELGTIYPDVKHYELNSNGTCNISPSGLGPEEGSKPVYDNGVLRGCVVVQGLGTVKKDRQRYTKVGEPLNEYPLARYWNQLTRMYTTSYQCELPSANGVCNDFGSDIYTSQPANPNNGCNVGRYRDISDTSSTWRWTCEGSNGGSDVTCTANKSICGDGLVGPEEQCDEGDDNGLGNCSATCQQTTSGQCGNLPSGGNFSFCSMSEVTGLPSGTTTPSGLTDCSSQSDEVKCEFSCDKSGGFVFDSNSNSCVPSGDLLCNMSGEFLAGEGLSATKTITPLQGETVVIEISTNFASSCEKSYVNVRYSDSPTDSIKICNTTSTIVASERSDGSIDIELVIDSADTDGSVQITTLCVSVDACIDQLEPIDVDTMNNYIDRTLGGENDILCLGNAELISQPVLTSQGRSRTCSQTIDENSNANYSRGIEAMSVEGGRDSPKINNALTYTSIQTCSGGYKNVCGDEQLYGSESCDDGNTIDGDGCSSTCQIEVPAYQCQGTIQDYDPAVHLLCANDASDVPQNTSRKLVSECNNTIKCEYVCNTDTHIFELGVCIQKYSEYICNGTTSEWEIHTGFHNCTQETDLNREFTPSEVICFDQGYPVNTTSPLTPDHGLCGSFQCQGEPPINATICPQEEEGLSNNVPEYTHVSSCAAATSTKCEYECAAGTYRDGSQCLGSTIYRCEDDPDAGGTIEGSFVAVGNGGEAGESWTAGDTRRPHGGDASIVIVWDDETPPADSQCQPRVCGENVVGSGATLPSNAAYCIPINDEIYGLTGSGISHAGLASCTADQSADKCEYDCNPGYKFVDTGVPNDGIGECQQEFDVRECNSSGGVRELVVGEKCGESEVNSDTNPLNTVEHLSRRCGDETRPVCPAFSCDGTLPTNAISCNNTSNLSDPPESWTFINSCANVSRNQKCNYECTAGYEQSIDGDGNVQCIPRYDQYECQLDGTWTVLNANQCTFVDNSLADEYRPGQTICQDSDNLPLGLDTICVPYECKTPPTLPVDPDTYALCSDDPDAVVSDELAEIPDDSTFFSNVSSCVTDDTATKCQFECTGNRLWDASTNSCIPRFTQYECQVDGNWNTGTPNGCLGPDDFDTGVTYSPFATVCIDPTSGVTPDNSLCSTNSCQGVLPTNAMYCEGDNENLIQDENNTHIDTSSNCSASDDNDRKCEFYCNEGFTYNPTTQTCDSDNRGHRCDATGVRIQNTAACPSVDYDPAGTNAYLPGDTICADKDDIPDSLRCQVCGDTEQDIGEQCDDSNDNPYDSCISCVSAVCGDGYPHTIDGGVEECDGEASCTPSCTRQDVDCTLSVSESMVTLGDPVTFMHTTTGPANRQITNLNFGDNIDAVIVGDTTEYTYGSAGSFTARYTVFNPDIQVNTGALAERIRKQCEVTVTVQGGDCGDNFLDTSIGEQCEIVDGQVVTDGSIECAQGLCVPSTCGCQNLCDEKEITVTEQCDYGLKCSDYSSCDENADCATVPGDDQTCTVRAGDGCDTLCQEEFCGDGIFQPQIGDGSEQVRWEECEFTGPNTDPDCTTVCRYPTCGDGIENGTEQCDPGSWCADDTGTMIMCLGKEHLCAGGFEACRARDTERCTDTCIDQPYCGDGLPNPGVEECDVGEYDPNDPATRENYNSNQGNCLADDSPSGTQTKCTLSRCGDGFVQDTAKFNGNSNDVIEQCDDGNNIDDDACSNSCTLNNSPVAECARQETLSNYTAQEVLDGDYNESLCRRGRLRIPQGTNGAQLIGGAVQWICDDNSNDPSVTNFVTCSLPTCGDRALDVGETCDDGNKDDGDGCSSTCQQEDVIEVSPICIESDSYPVIHDDEYLPFWWQGDTADNFVTGTTECDSNSDNDGKFLVESAQCHFVVVRSTGVQTQFTLPCFDDTPGIEKIFPSQLSFASGYTMMQDVMADFDVDGTQSVFDINTGALLGAGYLKPNDTYTDGLSYEDRLANVEIALPTTNDIMKTNIDGVSQYGQYEIRLIGITYDYCGLTKNFSTTTVQEPCADGSGNICPYDIVEFTGLNPLDNIQIATNGIEYKRVGNRIENGVDTGILQTFNDLFPDVSLDTPSICDIPFTISQPYFVQKGVTLQEVANSNLTDFRDIGGVSLVTDNTLLDPMTRYSGISSRLNSESGRDYLLDEFYDLFEPTAVIQLGATFGPFSSTNTSKVPGQNIFFYSGEEDFTSTQLQNMLNSFGIGFDMNGVAQESFTFVSQLPNSSTVDAPTFTIVGNLRHEAMYLIEGPINFRSADEMCDSSNDLINGTLLTKTGFEAESVRNDSLDDKRCKKGGLQINGLMFGDGLDQDLFDNRRASLSAWGESSEETSEFFGASDTGKARQLFETCYEPTLLLRHMMGDIKIKDATNLYGGIPIFESGPDSTAYGSTKNNGPVSIPSFKNLTDNDQICTFNTMSDYRDQIAAVKATLVEHMYGACNDIGDSISTLALSTYCGDGDIERSLGEECDDGNRRDGDGCSATCTLEGRADDQSGGTTVPPGTFSRPALRRGVYEYIELSQMSITASDEDLISSVNKLFDEAYKLEGDDSYNCIVDRPTREDISKMIDDRFREVRRALVTYDNIEFDDDGSQREGTWTNDKLIPLLNDPEKGYGITYSQFPNGDNIYYTNYTNASVYESICSQVSNYSECILQNNDFSRLESIAQLLTFNESTNNTIVDGQGLGVGASTASRTTDIPGFDTFIESLITLK